MEVVMQNRSSRGGLVGPVLLIGAGLVFLAQTLGWVESGIWLGLLRMWPLILIAAGIDLLIPRRSWLGTLVSLLLIVAIFAGGFWLSGVRLGGARTGETDSVSVPLGTATRARVNFSPPVAALELRALPGKQSVVEGTVPRAGYGEVRTESALSGSTARVDITASGTYILPAIGPQDETWRFGLTGAVPLDLNVSTGVGLVEADLTGLTITGLDVEMGIGRVMVILPADVSFSGRVSGAIGEIEIVVPAGVGVRIQVDAALAGVTTPSGQMFGPGDHEYTSPDYASAKVRVDLRIEQAIGAIVIRNG
jgi:hypothetical protein